jgi:hypothetical protein
MSPFYSPDGITSSDDGSVDSADYIYWQASEGSTTNLRADGNDDGIVDESDHDLWASHFDNSLALLGVG